jgi:CheY-like chemotaxis protein
MRAGTWSTIRAGRGRRSRDLRLLVTLLGLTGFDVLTVCDGLDALAQLRVASLCPAVILLDFVMPTRMVSSSAGTNRGRAPAGHSRCAPARPS